MNANSLPLILASMLSLSSMSAHAAADWIRGNITNITSTASGLYLQLNVGAPTNCAAGSWMVIPETNKTMIATALSYYMIGGRQADIYVVWQNSTCVVTQFDPA